METIDRIGDWLESRRITQLLALGGLAMAAWLIAPFIGGPIGFALALGAWVPAAGFVAGCGLKVYRVLSGAAHAGGHFWRWLTDTRPEQRLGDVDDRGPSVSGPEAAAPSTPAAETVPLYPMSPADVAGPTTGPSETYAAVLPDGAIQPLPDDAVVAQAATLTLAHRLPSVEVERVRIDWVGSRYGDGREQWSRITKAVSQPGVRTRWQVAQWRADHPEQAQVYEVNEGYDQARRLVGHLGGQPGTTETRLVRVACKTVGRVLSDGRVEGRALQTLAGGAGQSLA